jgi:hypothetical protein
MQQQITAEREKRALIAQSEGKMQEQINLATGEREAHIARSEGEKQAAINKALGEAAAIESVATASANALRQIAAALQAPGGNEAMNLKVAEKAVEAFTLAKYPQLAQTRIYDRDRPKERLKTQAHEQAMKSRTGEPSRKERIKSQLHGLFEQAASMAELEKRLEAEGLSLYQRGKSLGVVERLPDGSERRHRLATLGLAEIGWPLIWQKHLGAF